MTISQAFRLDDFFVFCDSGIEFHHGFNAAALGFTAESSRRKLQCLGLSWLPHVLQAALYGSNASLIALQHLTIYHYTVYILYMIYACKQCKDRFITHQCIVRHNSLQLLGQRLEHPKSFLQAERLPHEKLRWMAVSCWSPSRQAKS